jgi:hypothetical protein
VTSEEIDRTILELVGNYPKKVAMIVGTIGSLPSLKQCDDGFERVEARIRVLVEGGILKAYGDISDWRHSEVGPEG